MSAAAWPGGGLRGTSQESPLPRSLAEQGCMIQPKLGQANSSTRTRTKQQVWCCWSQAPCTSLCNGHDSDVTGAANMAPTPVFLKQVAIC